MLGTNFWKLWASASMSSIGDGVRYTAVPLLAAAITRDPVVVSLVAAASSLPWLLLSLPFGAVADRHARRKVMMFSHLARAGIAGVLVLYLALGYRSILVLIVCLLALASFEVLFESAAQAALPTVVRQEQLEKANGRMSASMMLLDEFAGPPLGAFLFGLAAVLPFVVDAASFAVAAVLLATIPLSMGEPATDRPKTTLRADIVEGLRWLSAATLIKLLVLLASVMTLVRSAALAILVLFALEVLNTGMVGFGVLATTLALGSLAGTFAASAVVQRMGTRAILLMTPVGIGALFLVVGMLNHPVLVGLLFVLIGLLTMIWQVSAVSTRQRLTPNQLLGRVTSVSRLFSWGSAPVGAILGGLVASGFGLPAPFLAGGALVVVTGLLVALLPPTRRGFDQLPARSTGDAARSDEAESDAPAGHGDAQSAGGSQP